MDLLNQTPQELAGMMRELGQPAYRGAQVFDWLHKGARSAGEMTNLPKALREALQFTPPTVVERQVSRDKTEKLLFRLEDGQTVEAVLMHYQTGKTICVSTQVGCRQGCAFCASTIGGMARDLTAGEILGQVLHCGTPVDRVVLMGIGEPLENFDATTRFLSLINDPAGRNMSLRNVTVSTCGLVPRILELSELRLPVTLSVSLHAPDNETRDLLMPINRKYPVEELIHSCEIYFDKTCRRMTYEYVMIDAINDTLGHARALGLLLKGRPAHVNLIPLNAVAGRESFRPSPAPAVERFAAALSAKGVSTTVRRRLGSDIQAACGQLRRERLAL